VTPGFLTSVAKAAGVDPAKAAAYAKTGAADDALNTADNDASAVGADSTPTFTIKRGDGTEQTLQVGLGDITPQVDKAIGA
jgi:predicted DsbA family dithiol-disulfide isomerase